MSLITLLYALTEFFGADLNLSAPVFIINSINRKLPLFAKHLQNQFSRYALGFYWLMKDDIDLMRPRHACILHSAASH